MPCAPEWNSTSATRAIIDIDALHPGITPHDTLGHVIAHRRDNRFILAAHPTHEIDQVRPIPDDRLRD